MKKWLSIPLLILVFISLLPSTASARLPYTTGYYDSNQSSWFRIQPIYRPAETLTMELGDPVDITVAPNDEVYVVDKEREQVIVLNNDGKVQRTIGAGEGNGKLAAPEGVFVTADGDVYVADSGNQRIAVFRADGTYQREYKKPDTPLLGSDHFVPVKLAVDRRGVMYIQLNSSYQGLVRLSPEGEFMGHFGANKADQSMINRLKQLVLNKEQLAQEKPALPKPITNVAMDADGFIYTATAGGEGKGAIRKLNAGGVDGFKNKTLYNGHGIVDVAIGQEGFLYNVDLDSMRINLYDHTGEVLFAFGFIDKETQQYGVIGYPTGIAVDSRNAVWISDSGTNMVHKYVRTEFGKDVLQALALYAGGKYEASKPYWESVYARNDMYNGSFQGLGKVYLHENDHADALKFMKAAFDTDGYSKAFWQIRLDWLQQHFVMLVIGIIGGVLLLHFGLRGLRALHRKHPTPASWKQPVQDLRNFGYVMIHPYEGFYRIKEARIAPWVTIALLLSVIAVKIARIYWTGFLFNPVELRNVNALRELAFFIVPWITWIIANYLVCSIKDGEGKFREVVQGSVYALSPYFFISVPVLILSNLASLDEAVLVHSLDFLATLWMLAMFFVMTQVIHNFDFLETFKNSAISVFAIVTIWLFGFIVFGLSYNLYDFFYELYKEVNIYH